MSCQQGTTATDVITYIGVPLAVLGVLPILWNAIKSLWIRHYLASLIPTKALRDMSLMIDPAAGVVIVILDSLELRWQGLPRSKSSGESLQQRLTPCEVQTINPQLIGCSWMGLYEANVPLVKVRGGSQRVIIDSSLRFESHGVRCNKNALILLALSLGVDPHCRRLDSITGGTDDGDIVDLIDSEGKRIMSISSTFDRSLSVQLCPGLKFSERRGLAWFCIMVVPEGGYLQYIPLAPLLKTTLSDYTVLPDAVIVRECIRELDQGVMCLELALTWTCYAESVFRGGEGELLPVPQAVLKAREDALSDLQALDSSNLETHLSTIFPRNTLLVNNIIDALKLAWRGAVPEIRNGKRKGQKRRDIKTCKTIIDLNHFLPANTILQKLYDGIRPSTAEQHERLLLSNGPSEMVTAGRVWLGLSIIQLWQREEWDTELGMDGLEVAKPSFENILGILNDAEGGLRHQKIYIG